MYVMSCRTWKNGLHYHNDFFYCRVVRGRGVAWYFVLPYIIIVFLYSVVLFFGFFFTLTN